MSKKFNLLPQKIEFSGEKNQFTAEKVKKKKLIESIRFLVSETFCDLIVISAAFLQVIPHVIKRKTEMKANIKTCMALNKALFSGYGAL